MILTRAPFISHRRADLITGSGFRVWGLGFRVWGVEDAEYVAFGFRVWSLGFKV
jgi:hypothetical protein